MNGKPTTPPRTRPASSSSPFTAPAWIAALSVVGLVSALLGDGVFDLVSWVVFTGLVGICAWAWITRDRR
jgi:hypothetical protein